MISIPTRSPVYKTNIVSGDSVRWRQLWVVTVWVVTWGKHEMTTMVTLTILRPIGKFKCNHDSWTCAFWIHTKKSYNSCDSIDYVLRSDKALDIMNSYQRADSKEVSIQHGPVSDVFKLESVEVEYRWCYWVLLLDFFSQWTSCYSCKLSNSRFSQFFCHFLCGHDMFLFFSRKNQPVRFEVTRIQNGNGCWGRFEKWLIV